MIFDILTSLALTSSILIIWFQRRSIGNLEQQNWEIENAYKRELGKVYIYEKRTFELWGNREKRKEE